MAKVTGPLMSLDASGTVAKTAVFSKWKGRNYVRHRVIPINRNTTLQKGVRSILGTLAKACRAVLTASEDVAVPAVGSQFFQDAVMAAPTGQSWISYLQKILNSSFGALVTAYGVLTTVAGYYDSAATGIGLAPYIDKAAVTHDAGEQLYMLADFAVTTLGYTGFAAGIDSATSLECSTFATYVNTTA